MSADILRFTYADEKQCSVCGHPIIERKGEPPREKCFCCEHNIPLPLAVTEDDEPPAR